MDFKYNIYYSTSPKGPWTLANGSPLDHLDAGNEFVITGLINGALYYISVVGGILVNGDFKALVPQPIGPQEISSWGMGVARAKSYQVIVKYVEIATTDALGMSFTVP